mgnify:CR=1 FL=1
MQAFKKFDLWSVPPVLIIHLKRFSETGGMWRSKLNTTVNFPVEDLDLANFVLKDQDHTKFDLIGVSV